MADSIPDKTISSKSAQKKKRKSKEKERKFQRECDMTSHFFQKETTREMAESVVEQATRTIGILRKNSARVHTIEALDIFRMIKCLMDLRQQLTYVSRTDLYLWTHLSKVNKALASIDIGNNYSDDILQSLRLGSHCILLVCKCIYEKLNSTPLSVSPEIGQDLLNFKKHTIKILNHNSTFQKNRYLNLFIKACFSNIFISINSNLPSYLKSEIRDDAEIAAVDIDYVDDIDLIDFDGVDIYSESESEE